MYCIGAELAESKPDVPRQLFLKNGLYVLKVAPVKRNELLPGPLIQKLLLALSREIVLLAAARLTAGDGFESSETISVQAEVLPSRPISTALFRSASPTAIG